MTHVRLTKEISPKQFQWRNDPAITDWTRQNGLISPADQERWLQKIASDPSLQMFGILAETEDDGWQNVGTCGLTSISLIHGTAEFSLLIGPEYQQKGYGKAALAALLRYGFEHLRLHCIWGETFEGNHALQMFKSLGMQEEGKVRARYFKNGVFRDATIVSILVNEAKEQSWWTTSSSH